LERKPIISKMWIIIILIVVLLLFGFIRGSIRTKSQYKVVNSKGVTMHMGSYVDCVSFSKAQNDYCKTFGINDHFAVVRWKL
jgi:hypothetical protein